MRDACFRPNARVNIVQGLNTRVTVRNLSPRFPWSFVQARSVIMATIADAHYLFVGLGDGHVVSFPLEMSAESGLSLGMAKKVALGTQPIGLACFRNNGMVCVFVASDRPAVIYCSGGKLLYANVNMGEVRWQPSLLLSRGWMAIAVVHV